MGLFAHFLLAYSVTYRHQSLFRDGGCIQKRKISINLSIISQSKILLESLVFSPVGQFEKSTCQLFPSRFIGLHLREMEKMRSLGVSSLGGTAELDSQYRSKSRTGHKLLKLHGHSHNIGQQQPQHGEKKTSASRPISMITLSDGSVSSLSCATTSASNSSNSSSEQRSNASSNASSSAFIGPNGKVAPEVLKQIAGFNKGKLPASRDVFTTPFACLFI